MNDSVEEEREENACQIDLNDERDGWHAIKGSNVTIQASDKAEIEKHAAGSNRVRSDVITTQQWEQKFYTGQLVASNSSFMAYSLTGRTGYVIRVIHVQTRNRTLLKGMQGRVADLGFANKQSNLFACVDQAGSIFIWNLELENNEIKATVKLHIVQDTPTVNTSLHRLMWCPQMPQMNSDADDPADGLGIAVVSDTGAEVWNVGIASAAQVGDEPVLRSTLKHGVFVVKKAHDMPISDLCLSPDGGVFATASLDGHVKFWRVSYEETDPNAVHDFVPHDGEPVSCLFFTDNHLVKDRNVPFWRFLVTGCRANTELKIWCAIQWTCLQTVNFVSSPGGIGPAPEIQIAIDLSASYLVLSDIRRAVLYIAHISQNLVEGVARIDGIMEFLLGQPLLSLAVNEVNEAQQGDDVLVGDQTMESQESQVLVELVCIHTKCMQKLQIRFPVFNADAVHLLKAVDEDEEKKSTAGEVVAAVAAAVETVTSPAVESQHSSLGSQHLMAPGDFTSSTDPPKNDDDVAAQPRSPSPPESVPYDENLASPSLASSFTTVSSIHEENFANSFSTLLPFVSTMKNSPIDLLKASSASSMSNPLASGREDVSSRQKLISDLDDEDDDDSELDGTRRKEDAQSLPLPIFPSAAGGGGGSGSGRGDDDESTMNEYEKIFKNADEEVAKLLDTTVLDGIGDDVVKDGEDLSFGNDEDDDGGSVATPTLPLNDPLLKNIVAEEILNDPKTKEAIARMTVSVPSDESPPRSHSGSQQQDQTHVTALLSELVSCVKAQQAELASMSQRLATQEEKREQVTTTMMTMIARLGDTFGESLTAQTQTLLTNQEQSGQTAGEKEKQRHDKLVSSLQRTVQSCLHGRVDKSVKAEVKDTVVPAINKIFSPIQEQINKTLAEKLVVADRIVRESIEKIVGSQPVIDGIGRVVGLVVQQSVQTSFRDIMQSMIIPGFEKACQAMVGQINELFQRGTVQYLEQVRQQTEGQQAILKTSVDNMMGQMQQQTASMHGMPDVLTRFTESVRTTLDESCTASLARMSDALTEEVRRIIQEQVVSDLVAQPGMNLSGQRKDHVKGALLELVKNEKLKEAFTQALSAVDLELVVLVCSSVPPEKLFDLSECALPQPILLSLIQQLAASDLQEHAELKLKYLQESVLALDVKNAVTSQHMGSVLRSVSESIRKYQQQIQARNPSLSNALRALRMIVQGMLK
ncbi:enhancer of mRNA-decapping protein 4-like isoform X2 [Oscarella lobularis]|uniref:enhancer of mRNA-decapping protein 4-like isoform X2 n=1 Tax=Oscarella lobularis TaxID=121494 RepID=UPI003313F809